MHLSWREAVEADVGQLVQWNQQLIQDSGHRNPMTISELTTRMRGWLAGEYRAVIFTDVDPVAYALFKTDEGSIHLRQFFVRRDHRRNGLGRRALELLRREVWPGGVRLTVDVLCRNEAAVSFWRAVGYRDYVLTLAIMPDEPEGRLLH